MGEARQKKAKLNVTFSVLGQIVTLICGIIVPRLLIDAYGSEAYGATASITQFLAYITLLEGGIGGVARAALYKPLADNNDKEISSVIIEIKRFFRIIGIIFVIYVIVLACSFKTIAHVQCFNWMSSFFLVIVISIATIAQYFIGISYVVLLQAAQKLYITQVVSSIATILNTILVIVFLQLGSSLIVVKLVSSIVFAIKPIVLWLYVKRYFNIEKASEKSNALEQKWTGLGQHIAFCLHSNTDIVILTIFSNLSYVAVYSVYNMIVSQIQNFTASFSAGMESVFGDMLAKNEIQSLNNTFDIYESIISIIAGVLFSVTAVMIVPFIKIYTFNVEDINYIYPTFALLLCLASFLYCLRMPYHSLIIAAGHFRQTKFAAYGEAILNLITSIFLVIKFNLVGVAVGTVVAVSFRFLFYAYYLSKEICCRSMSLFLKRCACNAFPFLIILFVGSYAVRCFDLHNYYHWIMCSFGVFLFAVLVEVVSFKAFYKSTYLIVFKSIIGKRKSI